MRAFIIIGIVALVIWMAFITDSILRIERMSETACAWAYAVGNPAKRGEDTAIFCPSYFGRYTDRKISN